MAGANSTFCEMKQWMEQNLNAAAMHAVVSIHFFLFAASVCSVAAPLAKRQKQSHLLSCFAVMLAHGTPCSRKCWIIVSIYWFLFNFIVVDCVICFICSINFIFINLFYSICWRQWSKSMNEFIVCWIAGEKANGMAFNQFYLIPLHRQAKTQNQIIWICDLLRCHGQYKIVNYWINEWLKCFEINESMTSYLLCFLHCAIGKWMQQCGHVAAAT